MKQPATPLWSRLKQELAIWRIGSLPGLLVIALVVVLRLTGNLQFLEWMMLDYLLRLRPPEPTDQRILIVGINEKDLRDIGTYPIPDRELAALLTQLHSYQPRVIALDIYRDLPVEPGHDQLLQVLAASKNLIGIEKVLPDLSGFTTNPPPNLPPRQIGFVDALLDSDGYLRRSLLGTPDAQRNYKLSLTLRVAEDYLKPEGIPLDNGLIDPAAMRFGHIELNQMQPNSGAYVNLDAGGNQILLNYRSGQEPFHVVSLGQLRAGEVPADWIRDRIVLIGITAFSAKDLVSTNAISTLTPGLAYGVEVQAHAISQIVSAVLDGRSLLKVWSDGWEYVWIIGWGLLGIGLGRVFPSPLKLLGSLGVACILLTGLGYGLLLLGWWVPLVPALLALFLNGTGLTASLFYRHEQDLRARIRDRQFIIDHTFDAIHNGPLQTLAKLLRHVQTEELKPQQMQTELERLNQELRFIYESVRRETLTENSTLYLGYSLELDLQQPLHESLYEVYCHTLDRDFPCFKTLKLKLTTFEELDERFLTLEQKRGLCRFLEEALCNVGKHAIGTTRLEVICKQEQGVNVIRVVDNGEGIAPIPASQPTQSKPTEGRGTQQNRNLARQLHGKVERSPVTPKGTRCQITWSATRRWFWQ